MGKRSKESMQSVSVSMDPKVLQLIDDHRGLVKRSTYIGYLLKKGLLIVMKKEAEDLGL